MQVDVREFRPTDELDVATIGSKVWSSEQYWRDMTPGEEYSDIDGKLDRDSIFLVAEIEGSVVGYALAFDVDERKHPYPSDEQFRKQVTEDTLYLDELGVSPEAQHNRAGTALLEEVIERASRRYDKLLLRTNPKAKKAMGLYLKHGFQDLDVKDPEHPERTYLIRGL
ncbi:GNAT family N-acetyltransferase [Candidatus Nanohaloarchaea archaeon]|nr:GNAT family N-acetyltransferase [Candidatus Nanohaloarchaea archaeon]